MRELKLSNVKVAGQSSGETNFNKVSLLLPFDGSDTATSTSDESDNSHTITFAGTAQLDTAQKKFGTASLLLDGDSDYVKSAIPIIFTSRLTTSLLNVGLDLQL